MPCDLKDFFLASPMEQPEYMHINMKHCTPYIIQRYNLHGKLANNWYVYIKTKKINVQFETRCIIIIQQLNKNLAPHGDLP